MYKIDFTPEAFDDLSQLSKFDQVRAADAIQKQLTHEPILETRNRKRLRPNRLAEWALRVDIIRVFYHVSVEYATVKVIAVGVKEGNDLYIRGEKFVL